MASGGNGRMRFGVLAAIGCVAVAVIVAVSGTRSGSDHRVASIGEAPATTAVTPPTGDPTSPPEAQTPEVEAESADSDPEAPPAAKSPDPAPTATPPALVPTGGLPAEVAQALADMTAQLQQAGDDGGPRELTREEIDALATEMLRALGIEL
ncbi:MAG TPA: hypothetical protein VF244_05520 [Acidimicrobiales bacterium]